MMYQFMHMKKFGQTLVRAHGGPAQDRDSTPTASWTRRSSTRRPASSTRCHYERVVNNPNETRADVWLAKDRFNFPVRVVFDDPKGFRLEQTVVALETR